MSDPRLTTMMARCRARSGAAPPIKATVGPACGSAGSLTAALLPLMRSAADAPAGPALPHAVSDFRVEGRVNDDAHGYYVQSHPFGGSVIEGYHRVYWASLADGVVLSFPLGSDGYDGSDLEAAPLASLWGDDAAAIARTIAALGGAPA